MISKWGKNRKTGFVRGKSYVTKLKFSRIVSSCIIFRYEGKIVEEGGSE